MDSYRHSVLIAVFLRRSLVPKMACDNSRADISATKWRSVDNAVLLDH